MANRKKGTRGHVAALQSLVAETAALGNGNLTTGALRLTAKDPARGFAVTRFIRAIKTARKG